MLRCGMKETGMVRRLDDLGRLVIPKEIRRMYKMKEGDSIEIYIDNGKICIRKYDEISPYYEQIVNMCNLLKEKLQTMVFFNSEEYLKKNQLLIEEKLIDKSRVHSINYFDNVKIYQDSEERFSGCIVPSIAYGNYYGSFIVLFSSGMMNEEKLTPVILFSKLLAALQH